MKYRLAPLVAVLALLALSLLAPHPERRPDQPLAMEAKGIVLFTHGDTIWKVTDKQTDDLRSEGLSIGYKFWYGGLFWIDFLTSDGTFDQTQATCIAGQIVDSAGVGPAVEGMMEAGASGDTSQLEQLMTAAATACGIPAG